MLPKLLVLAGLTAVLAACATSDEPSLVQPDLGTTSPRIVNGVDSGDDQDSAVMLFHLFKNNAGKEVGNLCTATMIAPNLALTARHCVAETDGDASCNSDGTPLSDSQIGNDLDPTTLYFFRGKTRPAHTNLADNNIDSTMWKPDGRGAKIFDDHSGTLCNHDIAIVMLDAPIAGIPIATLRLLDDPKVGELTTVVGWGISYKELEPSVRQQRTGVPVKRLGPNDGYPILTRNEFLLSESICDGDSGGPIIAQATHSVIGVVSRGGNGSDPDPQHPGSTCLDADNTMTKLGPFADVFKEAFTAAGGAAVVEPKETSDNGDCNCAVLGRPTKNGIGAIGLLFGLIALVRRRRATAA